MDSNKSSKLINGQIKRMQDEVDRPKTQDEIEAENLQKLVDFAKSPILKKAEVPRQNVK